MKLTPYHHPVSFLNTQRTDATAVPSLGQYMTNPRESMQMLKAINRVKLDSQFKIAVVKADLTTAAHIAELHAHSSRFTEATRESTQLRAGQEIQATLATARETQFVVADGVTQARDRIDAAAIDNDLKSALAGSCNQLATFALALSHQLAHVRLERVGLVAGTVIHGAPLNHNQGGNHEPAC